MLQCFLRKTDLQGLKPSIRLSVLSWYLATNVAVMFLTYMASACIISTL